MSGQTSAVPPPVRGQAAGARAVAMVFTRDRNAEGVIRKSLSDLAVSNTEFVNGGIDAAIATLSRRDSPRLLVVDITDVSDPIVQVNRLAEVCEPGVGVVMIGESNDIRLYRDLKGGGIVEYFFKPLVSNLLSQTFTGVLTGNTAQRTSRTGKLVFVLAVRGGCGATTIAVNSAWHLAEVGQRRVLLLDLDLHFGDAALQLDVTPSHALREALEHPERVDELFLERGVIHVTQRLDLLAALEPLTDDITVNDEAVRTLLENLLHRYRYVFVDMPAALAPRLVGVLTMPSTLLLVSTGSLISARDIARWRQQLGPNTPERSTLHILSKAGSHGSLPDAEFAQAAGTHPDLIIPYTREIGVASNLGIAAVRKCTSLERGLRPLFQEIAGEKIEAQQTFLKRLFG